LKLTYDEPRSNSAYNVNLRRYTYTDNIAAADFLSRQPSAPPAPGGGGGGGSGGVMEWSAVRPDDFLPDAPASPYVVGWYKLTLC